MGTGLGTSSLEIMAKTDEIIGDQYKIKIQYEMQRGFDVENNILDSSKLMDSTGWAPTTSLVDGLRQTWNWINSYDFSS